MEPWPVGERVERSGVAAQPAGRLPRGFAAWKMGCDVDVAGGDLTQARPSPLSAPPPVLELERTERRNSTQMQRFSAPLRFRLFISGARFGFPVVSTSLCVALRLGISLEFIGFGTAAGRTWVE